MTTARAEPVADGDRIGEQPDDGPPVPRMVRLAAMLVAFAVVLARLTLGPSADSEPLTHNNLRPAAGWQRRLGVPFGVLLPVVAPRARGLLRVVAATAVVMTLVELVQGTFITGRAFDIDDVILNATGAFLGYLLLGRSLGRAIHPRRHHWWHRFTRRDQTAG